MIPAPYYNTYLCALKYRQSPKYLWYTSSLGSFNSTPLSAFYSIDGRRYYLVWDSGPRYGKLWIPFEMFLIDEYNA